MIIGNLTMKMIVKNDFYPLHLMSVGQNIFLTIAIGISIVAVLEWEKNKQGLQKIIPIWTIYLLSVAALFVDSSIYGLLTFYLFYFLRGKKCLFIVYSIVPVMILIGEIIKYQGDFWFHDYQWFVIAAIPFLLLYNGKRGPSFKYFFYIFYPIHIWVLYYLSYALLAK